MCGVAGIVSFNSLDQTNKHRELFAQKALVMQKELSRRGPDGKGFFADQRQACFLVHRKLAITDFTASSDQPMHSPCGRYVIVFNGEVFNFLELKAELLSYGICFKTTSDTEVLLKYFVRFGQRTFAKLKGIFAIVIWDKFENVLHLARDRVGVKPLFYFYDQSKGRFFFASQVVPLVKAGLFEPELDQQSIAQFLRFYCVPYPKTMIKNIVHFPTGHYGTLSASGLFLHNFVSSDFFNNKKTFVETASTIKGLSFALSGAVHKQVTNKVPFGVFLSSGVDSTLLAAHAKKFSNSFSTFTVGFESADNLYDEASLAKKISQQLGTKHYELVLTKNSLSNYFDDFIQSIDQPTGDGFNLFCASKLASGHSKVIFSGIGADELFGGYSWFDELKRIDKIRQLLGGGALQKLLFYGYQFLPKFDSIAFRLGLRLAKYSPTFDLKKFYFGQRSIRSEGEIIALLSGFCLEEEGLRLFEKKGLSVQENASQAELSFYNRSMLLRDADAIGMHHSLEVRVPFLDQDFMQTVFLTSNKLRFASNKFLLRQMLCEQSPKLFSLCAQKRGFELPLGGWILSSFAKEINQLDLPWLNQKHIEQEVALLKERPENYMKVWSLFVLLRWCRKMNLVLNA